MVKIVFNTFYFLMLMISTSIALAADITATVDRNPVQPGESFQLVLEVAGNPESNPDLSPLEKDFDILGRNQSSSIQVINGTMTKKVQWILALMPKREGEITIPAIHFGSDRSNPVKLTVKKATATGQGKSGDTIFLEVTATPNDTWVQAQVMYTARLYHSVNLSNASLSEPSLSDTDTVIKKLGKDSEFNTRIDGKQYRIIERRYAIFPQRSGDLTIDPLVFNGQIVENSSRFMRDPFALNVHNKRVMSDAVNISVKAVPETHKSGTWLPANNITLSEEWQDGSPEFRVGESVTRTLTLVADGLTAAQLPELVAVAPKYFKQYPDQPLLEDKTSSTGIIGSRQQKTALIPTKPGRFTLPEITIKWWNIKTNREETAHLPAKNIRVLAAMDSTLPQAALPQGTLAQGNVTHDTAEQDTQIPESISNEITGDSDPQDNLLPNNKITQAGYWPWVSLTLLIGWLSTWFIMWRKFRKGTTKPSDQKESNVTQSRKAAEKKIKHACLSNDAHATNKALLLWGRSIFPDNPPASLTELGKAVGGNIADQLNTLNEALYSQSDPEWTGNKLWADIQNYKKGSRKNNNGSREILAPMYPG